MKKKTSKKSTFSPAALGGLIVIIAAVIVGGYFIGRNKMTDVKPIAEAPAFYQKILTDYPDSTLQVCSLASDTYYSVYKDRVVNGNHLLGGSTLIYSKNGKKVATCPQNPTAEQPILCKSLTDCKEVIYK